MTQMTNRRQFLGIGIAAVVWPGLVTATQQSSIMRAPEGQPACLYKAIFDKAHSSAVEFAGQMRRRGVAIHAIERDITSIWFNDLALQWRRNPVAVAGLTAPEALFCLEQLAWNHWMRVVFRVTHRGGLNGLIEHQVRAPSALLGRIEDSLAHGLGWGALMADCAIDCLRNQSQPGDLRVHTREADAQGLPLVSWVIAPVDRQVGHMGK